MTDAVILLTTSPDMATARDIANTLLKEKLVACVNLLPQITSMYVWQGQQEESTEVQMILKTRRSLFPILEQRIKALHPYDVPEILTIPVTDGSPDYLQWLHDQTEMSDQRD